MQTKRTSIFDRFAKVHNRFANAMWTILRWELKCHKAEVFIQLLSNCIYLIIRSVHTGFYNEVILEINYNIDSVGVMKPTISRLTAWYHAWEVIFSVILKTKVLLTIPCHYDGTKDTVPYLKQTI